MSNLLATMTIGTGALAAEQGALDATANNVANVNTPGFSRKTAQFDENPPVVIGQLSFGTGVSLVGVPSERDPILQLRIAQETGTQGGLNSLVAGTQQIQTLFSGQNSGDIGAQISALFSSVSQLSTDPTSLALRQGVLTAAGNLATLFNNTANALGAQRINLDQSVTQTVGQVNTLTQQIAGLNAQISALENVHEDAGTLVDQRDVLISQISGLIDVSQIKSDNGITLTTSSGAPLVAGQQSFTLTTQLDPSGVQHIFSQGNDITAQINSGALSGLLAVRDQKIPGLLNSLDTLAAGLATAFNSANAAGTDLNGNVGGNIFVPPPAGGTGAAASLAVAITDPALIAASSDGSAASNGNLANFSAIHDQNVINGETPATYYSNVVFGVGNDVSTATADLQSTQLVLQQLQDQRGSISGVSLDEEAANMVQFQRAYEAAARIVDTVNQMMQTVIHMGT